MIHGIKLCTDSDFAMEYNTIDTLDEYGLALLFEDLTISAPEVRKETRTIRGMDGVLDVSDAPQGFPVFEERTIRFKLVKLPRPFVDMQIVELMQLRTTFMARWQGKRLRMILPDDPYHYWVGRLTVGALRAGEGTLECEAIVYPYKLKTSSTIVELTGLTTSWKTFTLTNERRYVVPEIAFEQACSVQVLSGPLAVPPVVELRVPSGSLSAVVQSPDTLLMDGTISIRAKLDESVATPYLSITYREGTF